MRVNIYLFLEEIELRGNDSEKYILNGFIWKRIYKEDCTVNPRISQSNEMCS